MISLYSYAPGRLNLNGDQGNLLILQRHLEWAGFAYETFELNDQSALKKASKAAAKNEKAFLLVGHGSMAAMRSLAEDREELTACIDSFKKAKCPVLVVGSSFEALKRHGQLPERVSHFQEAHANAPAFGSRSTGGSVSAFGYINTQSDLPAILTDGSIVYTMLHGPVLAKSQQLLNAILKYLGIESEEGERFERLSAIRKLAIDTAKSLD